VNNAVFNIRWKSLTLRDRSWTRACIPGRRVGPQQRRVARRPNVLRR